MRDRKNIYEMESDPDEIFTGDDAYDRYGGQDLSGDPMLAPDKAQGRRGRKAEKERAAKEAMRAEILAEMAAEKAAAEAGLDNAAETEAAEEEKVKGPSRFSSFMMSFLSGNILSRQEVRKAYPYLLFIAFLAFVYIGNVFRMQHLHRKHERLTTEVKELRAKSMTIASEKMKATRQSNIIREIERRGLPLKESLTPNKTIQR